MACVPSLPRQKNIFVNIEGSTCCHPIFIAIYKRIISPFLPELLFPFLPSPQLNQLALRLLLPL
jgi:hypothetical protein